MVKVIIVGMKAVRALQAFFFPVGLKRGEALLAPCRLGTVLRPTIFTDKVSAHTLWDAENWARIFYFEAVGSREMEPLHFFENRKLWNGGADVFFLG
jgi:hypothetical protein